MNKLNKKIVFLLLPIILIIGILVTYNITNSKENYSLTVNENKWIDSNKKNIIDISILNEIVGISYDGEGLVYDYFKNLETNNGIKINVIPYKLDQKVEGNYITTIKEKPTTDDLVLLKSNMILVMKDKTIYKDLSNISNLTLGILTSEKEYVEPYLKENNITYVTYDTYAELKKSIVEGDDKGTSGIIILKDLFTRELIEKEYNISYNFNDLNKYITISLNGDKILNSILYKTYKKWIVDNYESLYNKYLLNNYYKFKNVSDANQKNLKSKSYVYGFIDEGIYNSLKDKQISGINGLILKDFNKFSSISITYTKYNSIKNLMEDFNSKKVDFIFNTMYGYNDDIYNTRGILSKRLVVISSTANNVTVSNLKSLRNIDVSVIKNSDIESELTSLGIKVKSYNNLSDLVKGFKANDVIVLDIENYNYYKTTVFKNCKIDYIDNSKDLYNYVINKTDSNTEFISLFNFYLNYFSPENLIINNYQEIAYDDRDYTYIIIIILIILTIYVVVDVNNHIKVLMNNIKKNRKVRLTKEEKMKYIDQLTSLKNRAYLNSKIEEWDESEIYPQAIIIIDLNNVSYVNDNYGREEGDKIITEAANVLIMNQLQNSEIIRTDGNEFLIYLVGYTEKQIVAYIRKLNRQLKSLSHGFGCATGYSIITDAIKTIDDAVNEATIDMKNNKEEIDY